MFYMLLDAAADTTTKNGTGNLIMTIGMIVLLLLFFYFGIIRPGKKQEKEAKNLRDNLTVGDEITTIGGIIGKVVYIKPYKKGKDRNENSVIYKEHLVLPK